MLNINCFVYRICFLVLLVAVHLSAGGQTYISGSLAGGTWAGVYILSADVVGGATITVASGRSLTIDLNGHVLSADFTNSSSVYVLSVNNGGSLSVIDSSPNSSHSGYLDEKGCFVHDDSRTDITLRGGLITNRRISDTRNTSGFEVNGLCTVSGGNIVGCHSTTVGSAVTAGSSGQVNMTGCNIAYNFTMGADSGARGGAVYGEPSHNNTGSVISLLNTTVAHNRSEGNGGGICAYNLTLDNCDISYNYTPRSGGGIFMRKDGDSSQDGSLTVTGSRINHNFAAMNGGGIYTDVSMSITGSVVNGNRAMTSEVRGNKKNLGRGGGLFLHGSKKVIGNGPEFLIENTVVSGNACMYYGGGIQVDNGGVLTLDGTTDIEGNTAVLHGAGSVHVTGLASLLFENGSIRNNVAHSVGGGIHSSYGCSLELNGGTISGNSVYGRGGGIHVNVGGELTLNGTDIIGNHAYNGVNCQYSTVVDNGDGTYSWSTVETDDETVVDGYGGGVVIDAGTCMMQGGCISGNRAQVGGGGIALVMINMASGSNFLLNSVVQFTMNGAKCPVIQQRVTERVFT